MALVDAMTRESYIYTKGEEIGIEKGRKEGRKEGKLEGIELALELKFGANGLSLMDEVRKISDLEKSFPPNPRVGLFFYRARGVEGTGR